MPGDRVVSDSNKVRLRVPTSQNLGHSQGRGEGHVASQGTVGRRLIAANVRSVFVVSVKDDTQLRLRRCHRITVYQVITVSHSHSSNVFYY